MIRELEDIKCFTIFLILHTDGTCEVRCKISIRFQWKVVKAEIEAILLATNERRTVRAGQFRTELGTCSDSQSWRQFITLIYTYYI